MRVYTDQNGIVQTDDADLNWRLRLTYWSMRLRIRAMGILRRPKWGARHRNRYLPPPCREAL